MGDQRQEFEYIEEPADRLEHETIAAHTKATSQRHAHIHNIILMKLWLAWNTCLMACMSRIMFDVFRGLAPGEPRV